MCLTFTRQSLVLTTMREKAFENIVGKGENAGYLHVLLVLQCFLSFRRQIPRFQQQIIRRLQNLSFSTRQTFLSFGGELTLSQTSPGFYVSVVQVF